MNNWQTKTLQEVGTFSKGAGISKDSVIKQGLPAVRYGELYTSFNTFVQIPQSFIASDTASGATKIRQGDILFAGSGETIEDIGKSAAWDRDETGYAGGDIVILRPNAEEDYAFLAYALNSPAIRRELRKLGQGQSIVHIYRKDLEQLKLKLPSKIEQHRIVAILNIWDRQTQILQRKIALKEQEKQAIAQRLLSGKQRLPGFTAEWEEIKLGTLIKAVTKRNKNLQETQVLSVTNKRGFVLPSEQFSKTVASADLSNYKIVTKGDFAYNPSRLNVGSIDFLERFESGILSPMYVVFSINDKLDARFFKYWLGTTRAKASIKNAASGSVRESVDYSSFASIKIKLPAREEQTAIGQILRNLDTLIQVLKAQLAITEKQKQYLLKNLTTGAIRTPENLTMPGATK